ncbi:UNVERIFIED_CONTAM: NADH-cytochrome b5 reductase [Siphonaria sp. JEL0065]|nr:NADH-cytochrome b5 reductase [Siphonaria sp. JEL0065]
MELGDCRECGPTALQKLSSFPLLYFAQVVWQKPGIRQFIGRRAFASPAAAAPVKTGAKTSSSSVFFAVTVPLALTGALYWIDSEQKAVAKKATLIKKAKENPTPAFAAGNKDFIKFTLVDIEKLTPNTSRFVFALPEGTTFLGLPTASCLVTKFVRGVKADGKEDAVIRPYTPVEDPSLGATGTFDLIVKHYNNGPMSTHIFGLKKGESLLMKGPIPKYKYEANKEKEIGLIAGGTGITPMLQVIQRALSDSHDETKLRLLFANVTEQDIILRDYLDKLVKKHSDRFSVYYTLDKPSATWTGGAGFVSEEMLTALLPQPGEGKVFVCGPAPMVAHVAGSKAPDYSQGEVGGLLQKLGYTKEDVFKF